MNMLTMISDLNPIRIYKVGTPLPVLHEGFAMVGTFYQGKRA